MMKYLLMAPLLLVAYACESSFSPKGPFESKVAVVAILTTNSDTQYVRVFKTYDPPAFDPFAVRQDQSIRGVVAQVSSGALTVQYSESLRPRPDTNRFSDNIVAYVAHPFRVEGGKNYNLNVVTPSDGQVNSTVSVPDTGWVRVLNPLMLSSDRIDAGTAEDLIVQANISSGARGYMVRFYLDFDVPTGNSWTRTRLEIPGLVVKIDTTRYYGYPKLQRRSSEPGPPHSHQMEGAYFMIKAYAEKLKDIRVEYGPNVWLRRAIFVQTQVDENLYTYYNIVNGYQDAFSIRTDLPDWTNINGGLGIFGAIVEDSTFINF